MEIINENKQQLQLLNQKLSLQEQEIKMLKKELASQLNLREAELIEHSKLQNKYNHLEKRYNSIRSSFFGSLTIKYWNLRKKLK